MDREAWNAAIHGATQRHDMTEQLNWTELIVLSSEKMFAMISIFLNLLRFNFWPKMWSMLGNVPCTLEKKVYSGCPEKSVKSISSNVSFKTCVSLLIFCFDHLFTVVSGMLKFPTIIVLLSISFFFFFFMSVSVCLMYWGAPILDP